MTKNTKADRHPYAPDDEPQQAQGTQQTLPPEGQAQQPPKQPQPEPQLTLAQAKKLVCEKLTKIFTSPLMNERLMKMAGGDASRVAKNLTAFLSVISQDDGSGKENNKKFYFQCSIQSLTTCFLESMNMQLPFDSRKLVSMVIYDWEAELDISYKGFVNALNRHYTDAFVECKLVFEGDTFTSEIDGRMATYKYKPADPFAVIDKDFKGIKGGYCFFSYTDKDGGKTSRLVFLSKAQILKNRSRAKQTYVWDSDPKAMGEKTCIREGSKLPFAAIDLDVDMEEVDNRHYQLEKPEGSDRLKLLMAAQDEVINGKPNDNNPPADAGHSDSKPTVTTDGAQAQKENARVDDGAAKGNAAPISNVTADNGQQQVAGQAVDDDARIDKPPAEISEADFGDANMSTYEVSQRKLEKERQAAVSVSSPSNEATKQEVLPPENAAGATQSPGSLPDVRSIQAQANAILENGPEKWDGRTVYTGDGKKTSQDFPSAGAALNYVRRVIESRKHKKSRLDIINGNALLIAALIKDGQGGVVADLHKLADKGE